MKKKISLALILLLFASFFLLPVGAADSNLRLEPLDPNYEVVVPSVDATEKVHDHAGLFTEEEKDQLRETIKKYQEMLSMDAVVVTTNDAKGLTSMEYADDFYDYNDFGFSRGTTNSDQRNGILFLIDMDNREVWLSTTGMAITVYRDSAIETILDAAFEYMPDGRYSNAADAALEEALRIGLSRYQEAAQSAQGQQEIKEGIDGNYNITMIDDYITTAKGPVFRINSKLLLFALIPGGVIALIVLIVMLGAHSRSLGTPPLATHDYVGKTGIRNQGRVDLLINTRTSRRRLPDQSSSSSGGGGFGGGGSSHSSSSGSSHGGGGRSF